MLKSVLIVSALMGFNAAAFGKMPDVSGPDALSTLIAKGNEGGELKSCDNLAELLMEHHLLTQANRNDIIEVLKSNSQIFEIHGRFCVASGKCSRTPKEYAEMTSSLASAATAYENSSVSADKFMDAFIPQLKRCLAEQREK